MSEVSKEHNEEELIKIVFSNPSGRKLLDIWKKSFINAPSYAPGASGKEMAFREGRRDLCLVIYNIVGEK